MIRFDQCAHRYARHAHLQSEMAEWLADWLPELRGETAIDCGAGDGLFTTQLVHHFDKVIAIDTAPRMVELGRQKVPQAHWSTADAWRLESVNQKVDAIVSSSLLQWCPEPTDVLRHWADRLKPGGQMLHGFYVEPTLKEFINLLPGTAAVLPWKPKETWESLFKEAGWVVERGEYDCRTFHFENARALLRHLHGIGAVRSPSMSVGKLRTLMQEYDSRYASPDGSVYSSWCFYRVLLSKK